MRSKLKHIFFAAGLILSLSASAQDISALDAAKLYGNETTYTIYRKGTEVGSHRVTMTTDANNVINVDVISEITVRVLRVPVFRFRYTSNEVWENGALASVESSTKSNKTLETASLQNSDSTSTMVYNGIESSSALLSHATNHWNIGATEQSVLFNTIKGMPSKISVKKTPNETLTIKDKELSVTQYSYTGDLIVDAWYDDNNRWVKLAFLGTDGSDITYVIDTP